MSAQTPKPPADAPSTAQLDEALSILERFGKYGLADYPPPAPPPKAPPKGRE